MLYGHHTPLFRITTLPECAPYAFRLNPLPKATPPRITAATALEEGDATITRQGQEPEEENNEADTYEDNGEFSAGAILAACLRNCEKHYKEGAGGVRASTGNILLVVTRKVQGCFVADMVQPLKYSAIRACAMQALERLNAHLATVTLQLQEQLQQLKEQQQLLQQGQQSQPGAGALTLKIPHTPSSPSSKGVVRVGMGGAQTLPMPPAGHRGGERGGSDSQPVSKKKQQQREALNFASIPDFAVSNSKKSKK